MSTIPRGKKHDRRYQEHKRAAMTMPHPTMDDLQATNDAERLCGERTWDWDVPRPGVAFLHRVVRYLNARRDGIRPKVMGGVR